jgi:hypothetical protein
MLLTWVVPDQMRNSRASRACCQHLDGEHPFGGVPRLHCRDVPLYMARGRLRQVLGCALRQPRVGDAVDRRLVVQVHRCGRRRVQWMLNLGLAGHGVVLHNGRDLLRRDGGLRWLGHGSGFLFGVLASALYMSTAFARAVRREARRAFRRAMIRVWYEACSSGVIKSRLRFGLNVGSLGSFHVRRWARLSRRTPSGLHHRHDARPDRRGEAGPRRGHGRQLGVGGHGRRRFRGRIAVRIAGGRIGPLESALFFGVPVAGRPLGRLTLYH